MSFATYAVVPPRRTIDTKQEYWTRPSRTCTVCETEYSEAVAHMHAARTGHALGPVRRG